MATSAAFASTLFTASAGGIDPSLAAANDIYERFMRCPVQKIAYEVRHSPFSAAAAAVMFLMPPRCFRCVLRRRSDVLAQAIVGDILNCDFSWTTTLGARTYSEKIKPDLYEHAMWIDFARDMIFQISLYGFVLYRLVTISIPEDDDLEEKRIGERGPKRAKRAANLHKFPEVANGQNIALRWCKLTRRWIPHDDKGTRFKRSDGWRMIQPAPPVRVGPNDVPVYKSYAANAYGPSKLYGEIMTNIGTRDKTNTEIGASAPSPMQPPGAY